MAIKLLELESQRREAILNAALKEFAHKGFDQASTNIIAKEAGLSKALMFHYVSSKQELFLFVYDYFTDLINKEYFKLMNFSIEDIFDRLRQSYLLQIRLIIKYPWIFEIDKLAAATRSDEVNKHLEERARQKQVSCFDQIFDEIDESKFRDGLNLETCKQFIGWSNIGFTGEILNDIRNSEASRTDYDLIIAKLDEYFEELRKIFYKNHGGMQ